MATLLLLNGAPAVGKSAMAARLLHERPLALLVDVDALRMSMGQWAQRDDSRQAARTLALALVEAHLRQGFDVVVPQYVGRTGFIETLAELADRHRARFVEVMLTDDRDRVLQRFRDRRDALAMSGDTHPEVDVPLADLDAQADEWFARLGEVHARRPSTRPVSLRDGEDEAYRAVLRTLAEPAIDQGDGRRPGLHWNSVCIDCRDADELAAFYGGLLGWELTARDGGWIQLADPAGGVGLNIQAESWYEPPVWPEKPDEQSKMLHFEIHVDDIGDAVAFAEQLGARAATHQPTDRDPATLRVMLDPAGHPFCLWT